MADETAKSPKPPSPEVLEALWRALEYLWEDEQAHYRLARKPEGHVFESLRVIREWLDGG